MLRVELKADAVTEEMLAKVTFDNQPDSLPSIGELAEVTVDLPALPTVPLISNAAVQREGDKVGVWQIVDGDLHFPDQARCIRSQWLCAGARRA